MVNGTRGRLLGAVLFTTGVLASSTAVGTAAAQPATTLCDKYASTRVEDGRYIVQNNVWGAETRQCLDVDGTSFRVTTAEHDKPTDGAPAAYPSVYVGCHYDNCTTGDSLPLRADRMGEVRTHWDITTPDSGTYNAAYDLWFDPVANQSGQNAAELMIWVDRRGDIQPIGSPVATVTIDGTRWEVWTGGEDWNVISYVRAEPAESVDLDLSAFTADAVERGSVAPHWYLNSVQAGFEPWVGGAGLATNDFSVETG
ncbi:GH12 family glycosyl hydrolase domain-containing protein [Actinopolyspora mortivallis]|uniref:Glycoside hydrolase n=1 Tax=Actinopolyspora mortivallis TaxID=33906 RepID=A0A2T0GX13_ACTMO|nr:glycoside hydrolase [Actinopolyspora mortivallis]PRW63665.1 glycoside hydrolase [Actinopolyspora mortivallis]